MVFGGNFNAVKSQEQRTLLFHNGSGDIRAEQSG